MRTLKRLYARERLIYQPELLTCPHCGDRLVLCNSLAWDTTVPMLDRVLSVASRPGRCPHATCAGSRLRLLSAAGQRMAPAGSTYGDDVVVRMGWWRQESRATYREMHAALASQVRISASHVGICLNRSLGHSWLATNGSTALAWPRWPRSRAA